MGSSNSAEILGAVSRKGESANLVAGFVLDADLPLAVVPERGRRLSQHRARKHDGFGSGFVGVR